MQPDTRYAKCGELQIAYQVFGEGPVNLVVAPPFVSNIENFWDEPDFARWLRRLGGFARVLMFDKRGTGLSDRVSELPGLEERIEDLTGVMDAVGFEKAALMGNSSEGGSLAALFAATYPQRCDALVFCGCFARFTSWLPTQEALEGNFLPLYRPTLGHGGQFAAIRSNERRRSGFSAMVGPIRAARSQPFSGQGAHAHEQPNRH